MNFLCYHRDRAGSNALRVDLLKAHRSYMDGFADQMIARGPTLTDDGESATGSVHILDLPGSKQARAFAFDEPNYQAGVYRDVLVRRWSNRLGRTMWQFPGGRDGEGRFFVIGFGEPHAINDAPDTTPRADLDELVAYGPLLSDDGTTWLGTAVLLRADDARTACTVLTESSYTQIEVRPWQFGGRGA